MRAPHLLEALGHRRLTRLQPRGVFGHVHDRIRECMRAMRGAYSDMDMPAYAKAHRYARPHLQHVLQLALLDPAAQKQARDRNGVALHHRAHRGAGAGDKRTPRGRPQRGSSGGSSGRRPQRGSSGRRPATECGTCHGSHCGCTLHPDIGLASIDASALRLAPLANAAPSTTTTPSASPTAARCSRSTRGARASARTVPLVEPPLLAHRRDGEAPTLVARFLPLLQTQQVLLHTPKRRPGRRRAAANVSNQRHLTRQPRRRHARACLEVAAAGHAALLPRHNALPRVDLQQRPNAARARGE